ncbi:GntR family transcriptional regulator [Ligilactobacillus sp. WILCCON 0076]|uniref:GntR family transcriptional regulator n=1 Tax=Ligilactobacillus ubinensis TaxID=2876789 RepID=A0A9X2FIY7_9LACO|nr:GntR family transcriptional regulator [Ligilactobacillus ubinensis]MCP0886687.1 GntR family transcriptional regulator [Ligilactobacillus ubinensis]
MKETKYISIAAKIESEIILGAYHDKLPSFEELAQRYGTSKVTISKVIQLLEFKGMVHAVKGHGTFVEKNTNYLSVDAHEHKGMSSWLGKTGELKSKIISFDIREPIKEECEALRIGVQEYVYDIIRQRVFNNEPLKLEYTIMPVVVIPGITTDVLEKSIYSYIKTDLQLEIGKANRIFRADQSDAYDIKYLDCQENDPIFEVDQVCFLADGRPFEYSQTRNRYDKGALVLMEAEN